MLPDSANKMDLSTVLPELRARFKVDQFRDQLRKRGEGFDDTVWAEGSPLCFRPMMDKYSTRVPYYPLP